MASATAVAAPPCPDCAGGGDVNGLECRACRGTGRQGRAAAPVRRLLHGWGLAAAGAAGTVVRWSATVPGIAGAAGVTFGLSVLVHAAWGWIPVAALVALVGGGFLLMLDRRI